MNVPRQSRKLRSPQGLKGELAKLAPEKFNAFHELLRSQLTYTQMRERALMDFGILTSEAALSQYYHSPACNSFQTKVGESTVISLARFELTISCPSPGVVNILTKELPPASYLSADQPPAPAA